MRTLSPMLLALMVGVAVPARAGTDSTRTLEFLGFSTDASHYLLKVSDANAGDFLSLRSFDTGKQEKAVQIPQKKDEKKLVEDARKQFRITDKGVDAPQSPDGRFTLTGVPKGAQYIINVMKGDKTARFQALALESGKNGPARASLKSVFWSKDGRRIVVVVHKKLVDENGIDVDEAHPYDFLVGGLNFR